MHNQMLPPATYNQFTVLIEQCRLLVKLRVASVGRPKNDRKVRTDQVLDNSVPDIFCKPTNDLRVFVVFTITSRTRTLV